MDGRVKASASCAAGSRFIAVHSSYFSLSLSRSPLAVACLRTLFEWLIGTRVFWLLFYLECVCICAFPLGCLLLPTARTVRFAHLRTRDQGAGDDDDDDVAVFLVLLRDRCVSAFTGGFARLAMMIEVVMAQ